jgi:hypothetical protein
MGNFWDAFVFRVCVGLGEGFFAGFRTAADILRTAHQLRLLDVARLDDLSVLLIVLTCSSSGPLHEEAVQAHSLFVRVGGRQVPKDDLPITLAGRDHASVGSEGQRGNRAGLTLLQGGKHLPGGRLVKADGSAGGIGVPVPIHAAEAGGQDLAVGAESEGANPPGRSAKVTVFFPVATSQSWTGQDLPPVASILPSGLNAKSQRFRCPSKMARTLGRPGSNGAAKPEVSHSNTTAAAVHAAVLIALFHRHMLGESRWGCPLGPPLPFHLDGLLVAACCATALTVALLASLVPARQAACLPVVRALP